MSFAKFGPYFDYNEVWVMNTEYRLFSSKGPKVSPEKTFWSRLDEMCKVLAVSDAHATVRLFWADGVVTVGGPDLGRWMKTTGRKAPSEQQMAKLVYPNIVAAWHGKTKTFTVQEALEKYDMKKDEFIDAGCQPTPGIYVWKSEKELNSPEWGEAYCTEPAREFVCEYLSKFYSGDTIGVLLDYDGAELRCFGTSPLYDNNSIKNTITILGGPKGIADPFKAMMRDCFNAKSIPMVDICLGPNQQMAHACIAYLRLEADAGRLRPALLDLHHLGPNGYKSRFDCLEAEYLKQGTQIIGSKRRRILDCIRRRDNNDK